MIDVNKMIPEDELQMMDNFIYQYAIGDEQIGKTQNHDMSFILREWAKEKEKTLLPLLHDNLTVSTEINITKSESELEDIFLRSICGDSLSFSRKFYNFIGDKFQIIRELNENILNEKSALDCYYALKDLVYNAKCLENKFILPEGINYFLFPLKADKVYKIQSGAKPMRIINKIVSTYSDFFDLKEFEEFRLFHSQILNEKSFKAKLYLSIHPLDYMTASMNDCDWDSCMNWEGGEYCQGTVEMMNSPYVLVAYLKAEKDMFMPGGGYWNNKKWREFIVVNEAGIFPIKGYPYWNKELEYAVINFIRELAPEMYDNKIYTYNMHNCYAKDFVNKDDETDVLTLDDESENGIRFTTNFMYNDFYSTHTCAFTKSYLANPTLLDCNYSGKSECMICGATEHLADTESSWLGCPTCYLYKYEICDICGAYIRNDGASYVNDLTLCPTCLDDETYYCEYCGETHLNNHLKSVLLFDKNGNCMNTRKFNNSEYSLICDSCINHYSNVGRVQVEEDDIKPLKSKVKCILKNYNDEEVTCTYTSINENNTEYEDDDTGEVYFALRFDSLYSNEQTYIKRALREITF